MSKSVGGKSDLQKAHWKRRHENRRGASHFITSSRQVNTGSGRGQRLGHGSTLEEVRCEGFRFVRACIWPCATAKVKWIALLFTQGKQGGASYSQKIGHTIKYSQCYNTVINSWCHSAVIRLKKGLDKNIDVQKNGKSGSQIFSA